MSENIVTLTFPTDSAISDGERKEMLGAFQEFITEMDDDAIVGRATLTVMNKEQIKQHKENALIEVLNSSNFTASLSITSNGMTDAYVVELVNEADEDDQEGN